MSASLPSSASRRHLLHWALAQGLILPGVLRAAPQEEAQRPRLRVGPGQTHKSLASAARAARDGMLIEVEAGDYNADVAAWPQHDLILRAVGGRVRLNAMGAHEQGKGLFVCSGERQLVEGFDFRGARVPDRNGAGIRQEAGSLRLRDCSFQDNENGLLAANNAKIQLEIEGCEFGPIVPGDGRTHNLYVGQIGRLSVTGSYFHHGQTGHLLKSRAALNQIFYNRLTDELGGRSSYELEFPNGGRCIVVGNVIQQSSGTQNPHMISYGAEGYSWPRNELQLINNTLVDQRPNNGIYLRVAPGQVLVRLINNLLAGNRKLQPAEGWEMHHNYFVDWDAFQLAVREDYRLPANSPLRGKGVDPGRSSEIVLRPSQEYLHRCQTVALPAGTPLSPGAFQR